MSKQKLPVGMDGFEKIRRNGFYYIDKTKLIEQLFLNWGEVNLFTRPRRFGKTLNMSMLKSFFEIGTDPSLFEGLYISGNQAICEQHMGQYPVIFLSLKNVEGSNFERAKYQMMELIAKEAARHSDLRENKALDGNAKKEYEALTTFSNGRYQMTEEALLGSLQTLSELLASHYHKKTVILIDEYDVPLDKAFQHGYYDEMVSLIRGMLGSVLKTNDSLQMGVLTGCLRITKESIFTGLNNFKVYSVAESAFDEYFGFTDQEVGDMLREYGLEDDSQTVKEWYDGYTFGDENVYCPWDVINYCDTLKADPDAQPRNYWLNTSSNEAVRRFIRESDHAATRREIEKLVAGEAITKEIHQELTYKDMYDSIDNLWSVLFTTGYLTQRGKPDGDNFRLVIPNVEIRKIFTSQIMELFKESVPKNGEALRNFCQALRNGDAKSVENLLGEYLRKTISIRDTFVKRQMKENFYHGILIGILGFEDTWSVSSNKESGDGYSDILVETDDGETGIILELKYAEDGKLDESCREALRQINLRRYEEELLDEGVEHILKYGIAFYKKRCRVMLADVDTDH